MVFLMRFLMVALSFVIILAISHDASVGTLDGSGAVGATACLLVIALAWRGLQLAEAQD